MRGTKQHAAFARVQRLAHIQARLSQLRGDTAGVINRHLHRADRADHIVHTLAKLAQNRAGEFRSSELGVPIGHIAFGFHQRNAFAKGLAIGHRLIQAHAQSQSDRDILFHLLDFVGQQLAQSGNRRIDFITTLLLNHRHHRAGRLIGAHHTDGVQTTQYIAHPRLRVSLIQTMRMLNHLCKHRIRRDQARLVIRLMHLIARRQAKHG